MTEAEEKIRKGRPRPQNTIERDEQVHELLRTTGSLSRTDIAEKLGIEPSAAYLSLFRLGKAGRVERVRGGDGDARSNSWRAKSE